MLRPLVSITAATVAMILFAAAASAAPPQKLGAEFLVNETNTVGAQQFPDVDGLTDGGFILTWQDDKLPGFDDGTPTYVARRFDADGAPRGDILFLSHNTKGPGARVSGLRGGGFVFTWTCRDRDVFSETFQFKAFSNLGRVFNQRSCSTTATGEHSNPSVAGLRNGGFALAYDGNPFAVRDGRAIIVDTYGQVDNRLSRSFVGSSFEVVPRIAALTGGRFVVVFQGRDGNPFRLHLHGVFGQLFSGAGVAIGGIFPVNTKTLNDQVGHDVTSLSDGGFVAVWQSLGQDGSANGIYGQRYNETGARVGGEFRVNVTTASDQIEPSVAGLSGGGFVVTWTSAGNQDGSGKGVFGRLYNATGVPLAGEFRANTYTFSTQSDSSVAALPNNQFVVVWSSYGQDGDGLGVYGQRFRLP